ncbi:MAG: cupin domain-containing protein [Rhodospirillaceae bacterium]|jgi:transcriptional regulator with XRE-family HTH domain|nr:cupin domain-containing protein [Rhodospirillaceae bacterium]MBT5040404.1 cupin domain-containing protein [Rhodospirillaceae bacterium]MBT5675111.1 cupin domain-containing protein [Rhodospirillaceae bacterium]MBT6831165.1 cupin domain-containing protein [Rhodospirillaceae bacterium]MBT7294518.1 cupin domain-containing protein [Rhodospirillaceae bacterium]
MSLDGAERLRHPVELPGQLPEDGEVDDQLGVQVRELRAAKGQTLQTLAQNTGLSVGYLSQCERGRSKLTVANLLRIARALDVSINWFFQTPAEANDPESGIIVRAKNRRRIKISAAGLVEELLSPSLSGPLELIMSILEPGADSGEAYSHKTDEAGVVVAGELELWVGERHFHLGLGDSFAFSGTIPHRWRNPGESTTQVVWALTPPSY